MHKEQVTFWPVHLLQHWNASQHEFLMFEMRTMLKQMGQIYIPVSPTKVNHEFFDQLKFQLQTGLETRFYFTNFTSVHVFKIEHLVDRENLSDNTFLSRVHRYFSSEKNARYWLCVSDVYVLNSSQLNPVDFIKTEFNFFTALNDVSLQEESVTDKLLIQSGPIFIKEKIPTHIFNPYCTYPLHENGNAINMKWVESDRSLSENNLLRSYSLKSIIFQDGWNSFCAATQHYLTKHEELKQNAGTKKLEEKIQLLLASFENYLMALFHELDSYAIAPIDEVFLLYPVTINALSKKDASHLKYFKNYLLKPRNAHDILQFLKHAASDFFSLARILEKQLSDDVFIKIDQDLRLVLSHLQKLQHSKILEFVEELYAYYQLVYFQVSEGSKNRSEKLETYRNMLKLNSRICSSFIQENVILQLSEIRIGRVVTDKPVRRLIEEWTISNFKKYRKAA
jgi:hypothetical protein